GSGKAAMELMGQWAPTVQEDASGKKLGDDLGFFPFPTVEGGQGAVTDVFGGGNGFAVSKDAPKEALDFLAFLMNEKNEREMVTSGAFMPVVKGAESALDDPNRKMVAEALNNAGGFQLYLDQAFPPAVGQEGNDSGASLIAGKKSAQQVTESVTKVAQTQWPCPPRPMTGRGTPKGPRASGALRRRRRRGCAAGWRAAGSSPRRCCCSSSSS